MSEHTWEREDGAFVLDDFPSEWAATVEKAWAGGWDVSLERMQDDGFQEVEHDFGRFTTAKKAREAVEAFIDSWQEPVEETRAALDDDVEDVDEAMLRFVGHVIRDMHVAFEATEVSFLEMFRNEWFVGWKLSGALHASRARWNRLDAAQEYARLLRAAGNQEQLPEHVFDWEMTEPLRKKA
jgi:uncharacterized protein YggL (DUF469 family)